MSDINDGEWTLPPEGPKDRGMSEKLMATGAHCSPGRQWNIDCMVRVVAPTLDAYGLLDGPAPWLEMRASRSEMAGGLTVEFAPHPDESDPRFLKLRHFRFRHQRIARSESALAEMRAAAARRACLMRRRATIDSGAITEGQALICDAVLPRLLRWAGVDADAVAGLADGDHLMVQHGQSLGKTGAETATSDLQRLGQGLVVHRLVLPDDMVYRSAHGAPTLVVRHMASDEEQIARMPGMPLSSIVTQPAFRIKDLTVVAATCRGDTTIFTLARPQDTLLPLP